MKTKLLAFLALAVLCSAYAQGTLQFTAHLTSAETDGTGNGQFTLTGNDFTYDVRAPYTWNQGIIQAGPDLIAPIIFSLHLRQCGAPEPYPGTNRGGCFFTGNLTLSEGQISDLVDGQWYVRAFRQGPGINGQITLVPEPSWSQLLGLALGVILLYCGKGILNVGRGRRGEGRLHFNLHQQLDPSIMQCMMKTKLLSFIAIVVTNAACGQGTLQFTAHLTSIDTDYTGNGLFTLTANNFTYDLSVPYGFDQGTIRRGSDLTAPLILDLHLRYCLAPEPYPGTNRGGCFFNGSLTLTDGQISDLEDNQWYVTATAFSTLRGQIVPIPEPSTVAFFGLALGLSLMLWRWRVHCERA